MEPKRSATSRHYFVVPGADGSGVSQPVPRGKVMYAGTLSQSGTGVDLSGGRVSFPAAVRFYPATSPHYLDGDPR